MHAAKARPGVFAPSRPLLLVMIVQVILRSQIARSATAGFVVPESKLQILVIGSTDPSRRAYIDAHRATTGKHFKTHIYTDKDMPTCAACARTKAEYNSKKGYVLPRYNDSPFLQKDQGELPFLRCSNRAAARWTARAAQRPPAALRKVWL